MQGWTREAVDKGQLLEGEGGDWGPLHTCLPTRTLLIRRLGSALSCGLWTKL